MNLAGPFKMPKTRRGACRQKDAILRSAYRALRGGTQYGMDWPTFKANFPAAYVHIAAMDEAYKHLKP